MSGEPVLGSAPLGRLLLDYPLAALDVGARGGFKDDLLPIASAVDAYGFEPDRQECERLNAAAKIQPGPWRSLQTLPTGLAGSSGRRTLYLTRHSGTSSMLKAHPKIGHKFSRPDYYDVVDQVEIDTMTLDQAAEYYGFQGASFLKIDIEGMELEVFEAAPRTMAGLLAIRTEALFIQPRDGQPLFHEIDACLRGYGFIPMGFAELHHWRRTTRVKSPRVARGTYPFSLGQLAHGDMIYFRDPETLSDRSAKGMAQCLRAAFIALCLGYVDHAAALLKRPDTVAHVENVYGISIERELYTVSRTLLARSRRDRCRTAFFEAKAALAAWLDLPRRT